MYIFKNRPFAFSCLCFAVFSLFCFGLSFVSTILLSLSLGVLLVIALVFFVAWKRRLLFQILLCVLAFFLASSSSAFLFHGPKEKMEGWIGKEAVLEGYVVKYVSKTDSAASFDVRLERIDGSAIRDTVRIKCKYVPDLEIGERKIGRAHV